MANSGYWNDKFMKGAGEACAISFLSRIDYLSPIHQQINEVLNKIGADRLAELTSGSSSREKVMRVIVNHLGYIDKCIKKFGAGFMDEVILQGLNIIPDEFDRSKMYSYTLDQEMVKVMLSKGYLEKTWWWKTTKSSFLSACRKIRLINKVHEA